jgi:capsid protein
VLPALFCSIEGANQIKGLTLLRRTSERLKNLQQAEEARMAKSKLADMAETNLSGNGVMGFNRQKDEALQE